MTWTFTLSTGSPSCRATVWAATIGLLDENQISARSARTSATQLSTSIGAWGTKAKSKVRSTVKAPRGGAANGASLAVRRDRMSASDRLTLGPGFHVMRSASRAFSAWSKVWATTATPVGIEVTATTPGMALAAASSTVATVPLIVGGRATTQGSAPGTARSCVYFARPVTMSRASMRVVGRPMSSKSSASLGTGSTAGTRTWAAAVDSSP